MSRNDSFVSLPVPVRMFIMCFFCILVALAVSERVSIKKIKAFGIYKE